MNYLILVNKEHFMKQEYLKNAKLIKTTNIYNEEMQLEEKTYQAFLELEQFLKEKDIIIGLDSAYRSLEEQQEIMQQFILEYGEEYAKKTVAPVGTSEHHTGLAIDFALKIDSKFDEDNRTIMSHVKKYQELEQYFPQFGFILRYPQQKEVITGYNYEPWHIRYIDDPKKATEINQKKLTLEEYLRVKK